MRRGGVSARGWFYSQGFHSNRYADQVPENAGGDWPFDVDECITHGTDTVVKDGRVVCRDCGKVVEKK